uniref:Fatty acid desaturase domain-containing protein n=1 Tax=Aureoumbra lagunensis TaxID=44058 RepID=A0A7S3NM06_9STRA|mmetsp:Transcript_1028/g.1489  ORF Transcript_1028/g.1489 Transcript_1028/m.1489 type:complete len:394 (+) Transcript_1028:63-1244(+)
MFKEGEDWTSVPHSERKDRPLNKAILKELQKKSDYRGFLQLSGNILLILLSGWLLLTIWHTTMIRYSIMKIFLLIIFIVWQGFLLSALGFACQHECLHMTAFKTKKLNDMVGFWSSIPSFSFYYHELLLHKEHHVYTQNIQRDPELIAEIFANSSYAGGASGLPEGIDINTIIAAGKINGYRKVPHTYNQYLLRYLDLWGYLKAKFIKLILCALGTPVDYSSKEWLLPVNPGSPSLRGTPAHRLKIDARHQLIITLFLIPSFAICFGVDSLFLIWLLPALVGPAPLYFCQLHEHAACDLDPQNGLANTRTTITNPIIAFVMWNMNFHAEHHLYTTIPFHNLPKAHSYLRPHLKHISTDGYIGVHLKTLRYWISDQRDALQSAVNNITNKKRAE